MHHYLSSDTQYTHMLSLFLSNIQMKIRFKIHIHTKKKKNIDGKLRCSTHARAPLYQTNTYFIFLPQININFNWEYKEEKTTKDINSLLILFFRIIIFNFYQYQ